MDTGFVGRSLLFFGLFLALIGGAILLLPRLPFIGRLPGDLSFEREGFSLYIPLATSLVISLLLTIALNVVIRILNR